LRAWHWGLRRLELCVSHNRSRGPQKYKLTALLYFYEALERCINALTELMNANRPADPISDLVDQRMVHLVWKAQKA
jgi:hypothetical protein